MSAKYPGGFITKSPVAPTASAASGVWTLDQALQYTKAGTWPTPGAWVDDVFSAYTYTGNGSTQTITNGIDLAGMGGLVWLKSRDATYDNKTQDTVRGIDNVLVTNATSASSAGALISSVSSSGFTLASYPAGNNSGTSYVSWTFRKAPKFFDVVTVSHTNGVATNVSFAGLGTLGMAIVKNTGASTNWIVKHRGMTGNDIMLLNLTNAAAADTSITWSGTTVTLSSTNATGTYVIYAFAHDTDTVNGIIQCGSFSATGAGQVINLGWEAQYVMVKPSSADGAWYVLDQSRFMGMSGFLGYLSPNGVAAEPAFGSVPALSACATGFIDNGNFGTDGRTMIYLAIRRPNKPPTTGTQVYSAATRTGNGGTAYSVSAGFSPDMSWFGARSEAKGELFFDRLRGSSQYLAPNSIGTEGTNAGYISAWTMDGYQSGTDGYMNTNTATYVDWSFKRAPGVFDVVCVASTTGTVNHNLGVTPELYIQKRRSVSEAWQVVCYLGTNQYGILNTTAAFVGGSAVASTSTTVAPIVSAATTSVFYLFATKAGISKVGSYTGNGSSQTINCGFSAGARFVLIKRTDSTGDWFVWDSTRGIIAGNDPHLSLNTSAAEVTTDDSVDTGTSGFIVNQLAATNVNVTSATYIYLSFA